MPIFKNSDSFNCQMVKEQTSLGPHLMTALLQQSSLTMNASIEAFCDGLWAWKALVLRLAARTATSVCSQ